MKFLLHISFVVTMSLPSAHAFFTDFDNQSADILAIYGQAPEMSHKSTNSFVLTSWNIYKGGMSGLYSDLDRIIAESDFVLMQEFLLGPEQEAQIGKSNGVHWAFAKSFKDSGEWTGVATASRWQPFESVALRSPGTEPFAGTPKMSLITKYRLPAGDDLWLVNLHGLNFDLSHVSFTEQIDAVVEELKEHTGPLIFAGDFNTWSDYRFRYLIAATQGLGLERAQLENPMGIMYATLDHIFYRGIKNPSYEILYAIDSSDHLPFRIEFEL